MSVLERAERKLQLYIDPDNCIFCGACAVECPAEAIFDEDDMPPEHAHSIGENARFFLERRTQ